MTRGTVDALRSAHPLLDMLPGVYVEDDLVRGLTQGLDVVLAPVFLTLDCLEAYVSPRQAPEDFLPWLASWVSVTVAESWPSERKRAVVASAVRRHRDGGTRRGLQAQLELLTDGDVVVGAIGVSAGSAEQDVSVAEAGAAALSR